MRPIKLLALALLAIFSMSIVAATTAQAETLEFQILPGRPTFKFKSEGKTKLETLSGKKVECEKVTGSGSFTSERLGEVEFKFVNCEEPLLKIKCTGLNDATGEILFTAEFHLRHLLMEKTTEPPLPEVSLMILVGHVHFSCSIALFLVLGSVCSDDILTKKAGELVVNKLLEKLWVDFLIKEATTGDPAVKEVDGDNSLSMEECVLLTKEGSGTYESSAQLGEGFIEACVNAGKVCTFLIDLLGIY